jgi:hypothetical protein
MSADVSAITLKRKIVIMTVDKVAKSMYTAPFRVVNYPYEIAGLAVG